MKRSFSQWQWGAGEGVGVLVVVDWEGEVEKVCAVILQNNRG